MIAENLKTLRAELPAGIELVAVSKFRPAEELQQAYRAGQRVFGESRPQEMALKRLSMPADVRWHQIGHLQTNKVRMIAPFVELIHSADSARLLAEISRQAVAAGRTIDVLLEIRVAAEDTKHGWNYGELTEWLAGLSGAGAGSGAGSDAGSDVFCELPGVRFRGVMGMATNTDDEARVRDDFRQLRKMFEELRERFFALPSSVLCGGVDDKAPCNVRANFGEAQGFDVLSMGMSGDFRIAIEQGATMVRVGSAIFS